PNYSSALIPPTCKHSGNAKDCSGDDLSIRGRGCRHHGCPSPKNANASGSRRRMARPLVALIRPKDLFFHAKDLFVEAIVVLEKPSSLLTEHDGFIHFDERLLDHRLRQPVVLQYLIIERHQHFELCERCLPKVLV